jgi:hypothetical protein
MKRMLGITVIALALVATGSFLSTFISNPFANEPVSGITPDRSPVLVNANGAQISVVPAAGVDGRSSPIVINVGTSANPLNSRNRSLRTTPVAYRPIVQTAYESEPQPEEVRTSEVRSKSRSWEREALIIGGSAAAGAGIGALTGGKKGAAVGAASGGIAGLVYDLATRK